jgi:hypothetical protein
VKWQAISLPPCFSQSLLGCSSAPAVDALAPVFLPSFFRLLAFTQRRNRDLKPT